VLVISILSLSMFFFYSILELFRWYGIFVFHYQPLYWYVPEWKIFKMFKSHYESHASDHVLLSNDALIGDYESVNILLKVALSTINLTLNMRALL